MTSLSQCRRFLIGRQAFLSNHGKILYSQGIRNVQSDSSKQSSSSSSGQQSPPKDPKMDGGSSSSSSSGGPEGSWFSRNKTAVVVGVSVLTGSLFTLYKSGLIDPFLPESMLMNESSSNKAKSAREKEMPMKIKPQVQNLPELVPYLIIGGGTASFAAFRAIRANDPKAKVLVVSEEDYFPYMRPPLSKELWFTEPELTKKLMFKQWNGRERSVFFEHEEFYCPVDKLMTEETGGVSVLKGYKVVKLDPTEQRAYLDNGQIVEYEKCLIATGGSPKNLKVFEEASPEVKKRVVLYRGVKDFIKLEELVKKAKSVTIVGGGFLGSELACALGRRSIMEKNSFVVNQIFPEVGNLAKVLPEYLCQWTTNMVKKEGVNIVPSVQVTSVSHDGKRLNLKTSDGKTLETDYVVVAVGLKPNIDLARASGLEIDDGQGGIRVNAELEARSNVWVAGDVSCFYDVKLGRRRVEHHDHAVVSGRLAGENMVGRKKPYWHQSMFWSDLGPMVGFEAIGIVDSSLPTVGVFAKASEKDTPKAAVEASGEGIRSEPSTDAENKTTETKESNDESAIAPRAPTGSDDYGKGVVFYLRDEIVVGILMWNVFNRMSVARRVINEMKSFDDLNEVAKLFHIHKDEEEAE